MSILYVVATPIGNLSDFSPRAVETLCHCDLIACEDTRHTIKLLNHFGIKTKMISYHKFNEIARTNELIEKMRQEDFSVALVSDAGTPCISDPGFWLVEAARKAQIPIISICGPSAVASAIAVCGFQVDSFTFLGFLPRDQKSIRKIFSTIKESSQKIFVFYESPKRIRSFAEKILLELPEARVCFCADISKKHEKYYYGCIEDVAEEIATSPDAELGEYVIVVQKPEKSVLGNRLGENSADGVMNDDGTGQGTETGMSAGILIRERHISIEALLLDAIVKYDFDLKQAMAHVREHYKDSVSRNKIYESSLRLKSLLKEENANQ